MTTIKVAKESYPREQPDGSTEMMLAQGEFVTIHIVKPAGEQKSELRLSLKGKIAELNTPEALQEVAEAKRIIDDLKGDLVQPPPKRPLLMGIMGLLVLASGLAFYGFWAWLAYTLTQRLGFAQGLLLVLFFAAIYWQVSKLIPWRVVYSTVWTSDGLRNKIRIERRR